MTTMPGPSASGAPKPRKPKRTHQVRQDQRRWIELIDAWHSSNSSMSFATPSREQLVEEISQHAQTLCRTIKNREWLLAAFHMAINAVLFPECNDGLQNNEQVSHVEQLGQQLLQLALHSVATPYLNSLENERHRDTSQIETVRQDAEQFERLSKRLSLYRHVRGLEPMLSLPALPLALVLREAPSTVLLCLASLAQGADIVSPLLKSYSWLVDESAHVRLALVAQLLTAGTGYMQTYRLLAASGLLLAWKDGHESSIWQSAHPAHQLTLGDLVEFYSDILQGLRQIGSTAQANALVSVLANEMHGQDAQQAIAQLDHTASAGTRPDQSYADPDIFSAIMQRFHLSSIHDMAIKVSAVSTDSAARKQLARELVSTHDAATVASRLTQLVDTKDSALIRAFSFDVVSQTSASGNARTVPLIASVLYARPAVGNFSLNLDTPAALLKQAEACLSQLKHARVSSQAEISGSRLGDTLRRSLDLEQQCVVPACQLLALLDGASQEPTLVDAQLHLSWLASIASVVQAQTSKPALDMCWLAAYGGSHSGSVKVAAQRQREALDAIVSSFNAAHPAPASLGGRADRSLDAAMLRFRAAWDGMFHSCLDLIGASAPFSLISKQEAVHRLLSTVMRTGDVELFRSLADSSCTLSASQLEELVLDVSISLFDQAAIASMRSKDVRVSLEILSALPATCARAVSQKHFIEAACRLSTFHIKSVLHPGEPMSAREMRETHDKLSLVGRLLTTQGDAHRSAELVLDLAKRVCALDMQSTRQQELVEVRTLAMLCEAASAADDFECAAEFCSRLLHTCCASTRKPRRADESDEIDEIGWKTAFQLSKHSAWQDTPARIAMLAHAMTVCPATQLNRMLHQWCALDGQLRDELANGKVFASTSTTAGAGAIGWLSAGAGVGGKRMLSAHTAASVGAGLVGTAANYLPLSLGSYFSTDRSTSNNPVSKTSASASASAPEKHDSRLDHRTASLFDFDNVSGASGARSASAYVDPAERAVRAARAARDFLGWKSDQQSHAQTAQTGQAAAKSAFSFSRGVGWLIGDSER